MTSTTSGMSKDQSGSSSSSSGGPGGGSGTSSNISGRSGATATDSLRQHLQGKLQAKAGNNSSSSTSSSSSPPQPLHPTLPSSSSLGPNNSYSSKSDNPLSKAKSPNQKRSRSDKSQKSTSSSKHTKGTKEKEKSGFSQSIKPQSPNRTQNSNSSTTTTTLTIPSIGAGGNGNGQSNVRGVRLGPGNIPATTTAANDLPSNEITNSSSGSNYAPSCGKSNSDSLNIGGGGSSGNSNKSVPDCSTVVVVKSGGGDASSDGATATSPATLDKVTCSIKNAETTSSSVSIGEDSETVEEISITEKGKKEPVRGLAWKETSQGVYIRYKSLADGVVYKPGDAVYIESQRADLPFFICSIVEFKRHKRERDTLMVHIKWFYRPCEVPETVYQLLIQDRTEHRTSRTSLEASANGCKSESIADQLPELSGRELFISDATDTYPVSVLRGLCRVEHVNCSDSSHFVSSLVKSFKPGPDCFFYVLGYNPETRRLASTQGEIRLGPSHQARLPELQIGTQVDPKEWEDLLWKPGVTNDADLVMYLRAARSMAAFAGMCNGGDRINSGFASTDDGYLAASRDDITINALCKLHESGYDPGKALQVLVKCPVPKGIDKKWSEDETKRFVKGLRQFGKNFFRIKKELLPNKETGELIEFYYLWKKTPAAAPSRTHRRQRRQSVLRRIRAPRNARNKEGKEDPGDLSSASEEDSEDDSDFSGYQCRCCRHCHQTRSKDWHHAGKDKILLCTDCRIHFKKYGELPTLDGTKDQPYLFRPVVANEEEGRVRTRTRTKELNARNRPKRGSGTSTPEPEMKISGRKSPGAASNTSSSSDKSKNKSNAASPAPRGRKRGKDSEDEKSSRNKKRKEDRGESPSCSSIASSIDEDNEVDTGELDADNDLDNENADIENSSSRASSPNPDHDSAGNSLPGTSGSRRDSELSISARAIDISETNNKKSPKPDSIPNSESVEESVDSSNCESQTSADVKKSESVNDSARSSSMPNNEDSLDLKYIKIEPCHDSVLPIPQDGIIKNEESGMLDGFVRVKEEFSESDARKNSCKDSTAVSNKSPPEDLKLSNSNSSASSTTDARNYAESNGVAVVKDEKSAGSRPSHLSLGIYGSSNGNAASSTATTGGVESGEFSSLPMESPSSGGLITIKSDKALMSPIIEDLKPSTSQSIIKPPPFGDEGSTLSTGPLGSLPPSSNMFGNSAGLHSSFHLPSGISAPKTSPPSLFQSGLPPSGAPPPLVSQQNNSTDSGSIDRDRDRILNEKDGPPPPAPPPPPPESSLYSSPLSRFYAPQHPGLGHYPFVPHHFPPHPHNVVSESASSINVPQPVIGDMKPAEVMPNPLQSLREVKVPGYPTFDAPPLTVNPPLGAGTPQTTSSSSSSSTSPFPGSHSSDKPLKQQRDSERELLSDRRNSVGVDGGDHRDRDNNRDNNNRDRDREKDRDRDKNRSPKVISGQHQPGSSSSIGPPSVTTMASNTMTTPAGLGPIPHPNVHPLAQGSPFPGAFHPHPHAHPLYHYNPYPYFSPYQFSPYPPGPQLGPGPRMPISNAPQPPVARPASPANHPSNSGKPNMSDVSPGSHHSSSHHSNKSSSSNKHSSSRDSSSHSHNQHQHSSHGRSSSLASTDTNDTDNHDNEDGDDVPSHGVPRGPSPEPKVEDSECHRSQSAIFLRHWNRGDFNSCARTDLTFKPVPDSKLARKREERLRKQAEKDREERERAAQARKQVSGTPEREKRETPKPGSSLQQGMGAPGGGGMEGMNSPFERFTPRPGAFGDTPALRQLSEYARPHTGFSPGGGMRPGGGMLPPHLDPMLSGPYQMGLYGQAAARERMEIEALEKREREIREIRERELSDRLKEEFLRNIPGNGGNGGAHGGGVPGGPPGGQRMPNPLDPHWLDVHRRFGALGPQLHQAGFGLYAPQGPPNALSPMDRERLGIPTSMGMQFGDQLVDRLQAERMAMDMRLQMAAGQIPYPGMDPLLQAQAAAAAGAYQRQPTLIPPRVNDAVLGVHPDHLLGRPYPPELAHHISAHEQLQRQIMMDRDRFPHPGHPGFLAQEEYLRQQQREREMKIRSLEEAAAAAGRRH
ncbi:arginine-glutamic acid dipeptide repeats protein isoform X2 [Folsomia candida]|uniref:arginine-glutamic acid dipeptide repeats protein isoform X2 n=1 Tax=Folsomia candida TaxID=158441 RepID=UPI000B8F3406|nr:arginine-glutamic acid dipeptide repeats protein isoform X2 [Folsomia candida]